MNFIWIFIHTNPFTQKQPTYIWLWSSVNGYNRHYFPIKWLCSSIRYLLAPARIGSYGNINPVALLSCRKIIQVRKNTKCNLFCISTGSILKIAHRFILYRSHLYLLHKKLFYNCSRHCYFSYKPQTLHRHTSFAFFLSYCHGFGRSKSNSVSVPDKLAKRGLWRGLHHVTFYPSPRMSVVTQGRGGEGRV